MGNRQYDPPHSKRNEPRQQRGPNQKLANKTITYLRYTEL